MPYVYRFYDLSAWMAVGLLSIKGDLFTFLKCVSHTAVVWSWKQPRDVRNSKEIDLDIRTHVSPKLGQDQVSGGVSVRLGP